MHAIDLDREGFGINFDFRQVAVAHHVVLVQATDVAHGFDAAAQAELFADVPSHSGLRNKRDAGAGLGKAHAAEHRAVVGGLRRGQGGVGVTHVGPADHAALDHHLGLGAEELRFPEHEVGVFAHFHGADEVADALRDGGVDRQLGHIAQDAEVVVAGRIFGEFAAGGLHGVGPSGSRAASFRPRGP